MLKRIKNNFWYCVSRFILMCLIGFCFRVRFFGKNNIPSPPYIVMSNHASIVDPALVGIACGKDIIDFMAKKELFDRPFFGKWCRLVGCIEVKRGENNIRSIREVLLRIKKKHCVSMFPEGTRSADGNIQEAKRGSGFIIAKAGVPVVPIFIEGTSEALGKKKKMRFGCRINVYVGKPVMPREFFPEAVERKNYEFLANMIMARIAHAKDNYMSVPVR